MKSSEYVNYDAMGLAELVRKKEVSQKELCETAISQIEKLNPKLNAVVYQMFDLARKKASKEEGTGPFAGVPFLLKDLTTSFENIPTSNGSRFTKNFTPKVDAELVKRYKKAGFVILGKTNTPEFGLMAVTEPRLHGPTRNPWDLERTPGGSSGGSAAAVAAGFVPVAHGGDGAGSLRIPASCCGLFGLKPTEGRSPVGPGFARLWHGFAVEHALTRSVRDSAAMLDIMAGATPGAAHVPPKNKGSFLNGISRPPKKLKIAFSNKPFFEAKVHPDCQEAWQKTIELCRSLGHKLEEAAPIIDSKGVARAFMTNVAAEVCHTINHFSKLMGRRPKLSELEEPTQLLRRGGECFSACDLTSAHFTLDLTRLEVAKFFEKYDMLLTPTLAKPPVKIGELMPNKLHEKLALEVLKRAKIGPITKLAVEIMPKDAFGFTPFTPLFNICGQPAMSVPLHWNSEGLPIGSQFVGKFGQDATLLRLAAQLEQARPWFNKRPKLN